jgi:hypothetical protein
MPLDIIRKWRRELFVQSEPTVASQELGTECYEARDGSEYIISIL